MTTFIGRKRELDELRAALEDALAGRGRLVMLVGDPGIGKTRTSQELTAIAREQGAMVLWGPCHEGQGAPAYWPWVQIIRNAVREIDVGSLRKQMGPGASDIAEIVPEVRERMRDVTSPPTLDPEQARFRLFDSITSFIKNAARARPLALILDDLHWADEPSLLLLQFVAREIADARVLIVGAYRPGEVGRVHPLYQTLGDLTRGERVLLHGLGETDTGLFVEAAIGRAPPDSLVSALQQLTEGNPFFLGESVRLLAAEGRLEYPEQFAAGTIDIPIGARELISRRLDRLSAECNEALSIASVVGREFDLGAIAAVSGRTPDETAEILGDAVAAGIVTQTPRSVGRYSFSHLLIRETLYEEIPTTRRIPLHRQIAETLERIYARDPEPHLAELAYHFLEAAPGGDIDKAFGYAARAGDRAAAQLAHEEAAVHYERALQVLDLKGREPRPRAELLIALGVARRRSGHLEQALETFAQAADFCEEARSPELLAQAALEYGTESGVEGLANLGVGEDKVRALLERALEALPETDSPLRARVLGRLAGALHFTGDHERRASLARLAVDMAERTGDPHAILSALNSSRFAMAGLDEEIERRAAPDKLLRLAEEAGDTERVLQAIRWSIADLIQSEDVAGADHRIEQYARLAKELRQPLHHAITGVLRAMRAMMNGRYSDAEAYARQAIAMSEQLPESVWISVPMGQVLLSRIERGLTEGVDEGVSRSFAEGRGHPVVRAGIAAEALMALGRVAEARAEFEQLAAHDFADMPRDQTWLNYLVFCSRLAVDLGDRKRAEKLYDLLLSSARLSPTTGQLPGMFYGPVTYYLGTLASLFDRRETAAAHFEDALARCIAMGARPLTARVQEAYGELLLRNGDEDRGRALATEALATAEELGMRPLAEKCRALLGQAPIPPRNGDAGSFRREGEYWTIAHEGTTSRFKAAKGFEYLARLLAVPRKEVHVSELAGSALVEAADAALDDRAKAEYRRRAEDLREELAEAERNNDAERAARAHEELEAIADQLAGAVGLGGRDRPTASTAERQRVAVTKAIKSSIAKIAEANSALGRHLDQSIKTGYFCSYSPERPIAWEL